MRDSVIPGAAATGSIVWQSSVGAGQIVVSGALDAWRFRETGTGGFGKFWRTLIAASADRALPPLRIALERSPVLPGEDVMIDVTVRDAALAPLTGGSSTVITAEATLDVDSARVAFRLWPGVSVGTLRGTVRAPSRAGNYRIRVAAEGASAEAVLIVADTVRRAAPDERPMLAAFAESRGGRVLDESQLDDLAPALSAALDPERHRELWHPMRSPWWLIPLALALGAEWWLRRRQGLA
jgi:hypothetical protein